MKLKDFLRVFPESQEIEIYQVAGGIQVLYHGDCVCPHALSTRRVSRAYFTKILVIEIEDLAEELENE